MLPIVLVLNVNTQSRLCHYAPLIALRHHMSNRDLLINPLSIDRMLPSNINYIFNRAPEING